jgi:hypothetical protein
MNVMEVRKGKLKRISSFLLFEKYHRNGWGSNTAIDLKCGGACFETIPDLRQENYWDTCTVTIRIFSISSIILPLDSTDS